MFDGFDNHEDYGPDYDLPDAHLQFIAKLKAEFIAIDQNFFTEFRTLAQSISQPRERFCFYHALLRDVAQTHLITSYIAQDYTAHLPRDLTHHSQDYVIDLSAYFLDYYPKNSPEYAVHHMALTRLAEDQSTYTDIRMCAIEALLEHAPHTTPQEKIKPYTAAWHDLFTALGTDTMHNDAQHMPQEDDPEPLDSEPSDQEIVLHRVLDIKTNYPDQFVDMLRASCAQFLKTDPHIKDSSRLRLIQKMTYHLLDRPEQQARWTLYFNQEVTRQSLNKDTPLNFENLSDGLMSYADETNLHPEYMMQIADHYQTIAKRIPYWDMVDRFELDKSPLITSQISDIHDLPSEEILIPSTSRKLQRLLDEARESSLCEDGSDLRRSVEHTYIVIESIRKHQAAATDPHKPYPDAMTTLTQRMDILSYFDNTRNQSLFTYYAAHHLYEVYNSLSKDGVLNDYKQNLETAFPPEEIAHFAAQKFNRASQTQIHKDIIKKSKNYLAYRQ